MNKKQLAILLSKIKSFENPNVRLEQYQTSSEIAASALWIANLNNDIKGKNIIDLGCGTGIIGLGCLALGARHVYFVDVDGNALNIVKENVKYLQGELGKKFKYDIVNYDVKDFNKKGDVVFQNPPFGVKKSHTDKLFLMKAMFLSKKVYSFHKKESEKFLGTFSNDNGFSIKHLMQFSFPLKRTFRFHIKRVKYIDVCFYMLTKKLKN